MRFCAPANASVWASENTAGGRRLLQSLGIERPPVIAVLKNDHRALTDKLEELLTQLHAQSKGRSSSSEATASQASQHSAMPAANGSASHITQSSAPQQSRPFALGELALSKCDASRQERIATSTASRAGEPMRLRELGDNE